LKTLRHARVAGPRCRPRYAECSHAMRRGIDLAHPGGARQDPEMIELVNLSKRYGSTLAVDDLSLQVAAGGIFGFLGPNGAGKTTTIRMMMGLLQPTAGRVILGGYDLASEGLAAKQLCGFVPDRPHVYEKLTGAEFLDFVAGLYQVPPAVSAVRRDQL